MKQRVYAACLLAATILVAVSCTDDDEYEPGMPTAESSVGAYFASSNPSEFIFEPGMSQPVEIAIVRLDKREAVDVPVVCNSKDEGLDIPAFARFEAGRDTAYLTVSVSQPELSRKYSFSLSIGEGHANHYSAVEGSSYYDSYILEESWKVLCDTVKVSWTLKGKPYTDRATIEQLGNTERYRIVDFLHSGVNFTFEKGPSASVKGNYLIKPISNYEDAEETVYSGYYFVIDAATENYSWTFQDVDIYYMIIITTYYGYGDYSYFSIEDKRITITPGTFYPDGTANGTEEWYNYLYFTW